MKALKVLPLLLFLAITKPVMCQDELHDEIGIGFLSLVPFTTLSSDPEFYPLMNATYKIEKDNIKWRFGADFSRKTQNLRELVYIWDPYEVQYIQTRYTETSFSLMCGIERGFQIGPVRPYLGADFLLTAYGIYDGGPDSDEISSYGDNHFFTGGPAVRLFGGIEIRIVDRVSVGVESGAAIGWGIQEGEDQALMSLENIRGFSIKYHF